MRLVRRILAVLGVAVCPAVVAAIGCNNNISSLPGLQDELPNILGMPVVIPTDGSASDAPNVPLVAPMSLCDCAASLNSPESSTGCAMCQNMYCTNENSACAVDTCDGGLCCSTAAECVNMCSPTDGACISNCIDLYPDYANLLNCLLMNCNVSDECGVAANISPCTAMAADAGTD